MFSSSSSSGAIPLQNALDHYFQLALYLLVLTGFATLASTGGLDLPSLVLVGTVLTIRGYLLAKRRTFVISDRWTTPLSLAYFAFFAIDYLAFSRSFLPATIHLALFGVVVRMFSLRRERDHIMLAILAFLMVLASAVLTVDSVFLLSFAAFMLIAVATFILMEMRRSGSAATIQARYSTDPYQRRRLAFALMRTAPLLMMMILAGGAALFFVMPRRISAGHFGEYSFVHDLSSGFSDHVQLGQIGQIQQSNAVVMHVQIEGDDIGRYELHWRGVSLADFDGQTWSNPKGQYFLSRNSDNGFDPPQNDAPIHFYDSASLAREKIIHYRVIMEPIGTNVFFLAPWARSLSGNYRALSGDSGGAVYNSDSDHTISRYEATSDIAKPSADELRKAGLNYPRQIPETYLHFPQLDPRIPRLAADITRSAKNDYDKATAIETYLKTRFGYTLQLPQTTVKDPLANFLFERKQGHCEYFASSMAVMLRTLAIPSRVVNGFRSDEFNDITGNYVVRAKDAHSWVEAYFAGYGWQTFDPTPGGNGDSPQGWNRLALYVDAMASFWRDWVVSYDTSNQYVLGKAAVSGSLNLWEGARTWARNHYAAMLKWAKHSQDRVENSPRQWTIIGIAIVLGFVLLANLGRIARLLHERWLRVHPERSPEQAASMWYERMTRILAKHGMRKPQAETPQEFLKKIDYDRLREPVARFTEVYESARFGNSAEDAQRLPGLYEEVEMATRSE